MPGIERLLQLPQPSFEEGSKNPANVLARRAFQGSAINARILSKASVPVRSAELRSIEHHVDNRRKESSHLSPAFDLLDYNTLYLPRGIFLRAGPFHCDNWLRDSFYGTLFVDEPHFESHVLGQFDKADQSGHLPTTRLFPGGRMWRFDDESTMLGLIWRAKLADRGIPLEGNELDRWKNRWNFVQGQVEDGQFVSQPGTEKSWFDTYKVQQPDVLTYNQGIYAAATIGAAHLGIADANDVEDAIIGYRGLSQNSGRLQFSRSLPYHDRSALMGEFLALRLFGESLLDDQTVLHTVEQLPTDYSGAPVVTREDGSYLDPEEFNRHYMGGDYQNGGNWPLFNAVSQATAENHGLPHRREFWRSELSTLARTSHAEYTYTGPNYSYVSFDPDRQNNLWNTAVYDAALTVMTPADLTEILNNIDFERHDVLVSEASQMPGSYL